jgi:hypothetical protein
LLDDGKDAFETMYDMHAHYIDGKTDIKIDKTLSADISIDDIELFSHNSTLDHLLENYDAWFKRKISFDNIYVESFCAGVYVKNVHNLLISMLHKSFPGMTCLSPEQLDDIYASLTTEARNAYFTLTLMDPDELNGSHVLLNLEDYEFEPLLRWKGPEIARNAKGKVICIGVTRNEPSADQIPVLCTHCKRYYNHDELNQLCTVNRFDQRNAGDFKCRAYEKR